MQDEDLPIDYAEMPIGPEDLDDFEFQLFVALRKWRLDKARSLLLNELNLTSIVNKSCQMVGFDETFVVKSSDPI